MMEVHINETVKTLRHSPTMLKSNICINIYKSIPPKLQSPNSEIKNPIPR
jgi:hypothetical protein